MASDWKRVLTPEEARALQKPEVQRHVEQINATLIRGERLYYLSNALVEDVVAAVRASSWLVTVAPLSANGAGLYSALRFDEPKPSDDATAEALGARVLAGNG